MPSCEERAVLPILFSPSRTSERVLLWHDPAHVLVGISAGRQPKPWGYF